MSYLLHNERQKKIVQVVYELDNNCVLTLCCKTATKLMHFNFDACAMHSPLGFVHLGHQNLSVCIILSKFTRKSKYAAINL